MEIKRIDVFDFNVVLTEDEFAVVSAYADTADTTIELVLELLIENGFESIEVS